MKHPSRTASTRRTADSWRAEREFAALRAARALVDRMRTLYAELESLTCAPISMHRALSSVGAAPGIHASALAEQLAMQRPATSQLLRSMVERGWVERRRDLADQRAVRIYLTVAGRRLLRATAGRAVGTLQRAVQALNRADLARLAAGLPALLHGLPDPTGPRLFKADRQWRRGKRRQRSASK